VEGVLGPGAANNSTLGGSLITTVAFGVPASVVMAILLGAFIIQGIVPGPDMLIPPPKGKLDLTFSFVWVIILSNFITVAICFLFLNTLAKVTQVRGSLIIPLILLLIYLGAFAEKNAFEDMIVVLFFGGLGWIMEKFQWPRPPVLLGLVLGPLAENRLFLASDNYGTAWMWRPGVLIIFAVTLLGIVYPIIKRKWEQKTISTTAAAATAESVPKTGLELDGRVLFTVCVIILLALALWQSRNFGFRAGLFPWVIGTPTLVLTLLQLAKDLTGRKKISAPHLEAGATFEVAPEVASRRTWLIIGWIVGFFIAIWLLGFSIAVPLTLVLYLWLAGREKWPTIVMVTFFAWLFFYLLFERTLKVPFPDGLVFGLFKGQ
jgi:Tripartite tricarboxylate transporter TctA family/Tripartite tricarboxylate transporter TctB family